MKFDEILMMCRDRNGLNSWAELAWALGMTESGLRAIRKGTGGALKETTLETIMRGSGLPAPVIVAAWEAENCRNEYVRESWLKYLDLYRNSPAPKKECQEKQGVEKMCIMLSKPELSHGWQMLEDQPLRDVFGQTGFLGFSPMGIRTGVTYTRPQEMTAPIAPWTGPERRRDQHPPWTGPERRAA